MRQVHPIPFRRLPPIPIPTTVEERAAVRGCRNCSFYESSQGLCHVDNQSIPTRSWCGRWLWSLNPQQTWTSAFARLELELAQESQLDNELAKSVAAAENPDGRPAAPETPKPPNWQPDPFTPFEFGRHVPPGETPFFEMLD